MLDELGGLDLPVFLALGAGAGKTNEIGEMLGASSRRVRESLKNLTDAELVERPDYRNWKLSIGGHNLLTGYMDNYLKLAEADNMSASGGHKLLTGLLEEDNMSASGMTAILEEDNLSASGLRKDWQEYAPWLR